MTDIYAEIARLAADLLHEAVNAQLENDTARSSVGRILKQLKGHATVLRGDARRTARAGPHDDEAKDQGQHETLSDAQR